MNFAIIQTGGKQYKVSPGQKLRVEKIPKKEGEGVNFDRVFLIKDDSGVKIGNPCVGGATVEARVLKQLRDKKKIVFRYHSKTRYRKKKGHRQSLTEVEVANISY